MVILTKKMEKIVNITTTARIFVRDGQERWFWTKVKAGHGDMWLEHVYLQIISAYYRTRVNTQRPTRWITPKSRVHDEQLVHTTIHDLPSALRPRSVVSENTCPCPSFAFIRVIVCARAANVRDIYRHRKS